MTEWFHDPNIDSPSARGANLSHGQKLTKNTDSLNARGTNIGHDTKDSLRIHTNLVNMRHNNSCT